MRSSIRGYLIWFIVTLFVVYAFFLNTAGAVFAAAFKTSLNLSDMGASFAVGSFVLGFACIHKARLQKVLMTPELTYQGAQALRSR